MSVGLRVVRGPDWKHEDKDGGEGHLGTIVAVKDNNTAEVVWDNGNQLTCCIGKNGKRDLRVVDNAPAGIKHFGITCKECKRQPILGTRWKCCTCKDVNLCTICYVSDKHDLNHEFERYNRQTTIRPEKVKKRATSQKMRAFGIFPGSIVVRGKDWNYGNDDGGTGSKGKVTDLINHSTDTGARNAVRVAWEKGKKGDYRIGASGKVDVKCLETSVGHDYYRDHLYVPDSSIRLTREVSFLEPQKAAKTEAGFLEKNNSNSEDVENPGLETVIRVGDRVCVFLPADELKEVQRGRGGWSMRMTECIGRIGTVKGIESDEIIEVMYEDNSWHFYQGALRKVYDVKVGDAVRVLSGVGIVKLLQNGHGGWEDSMEKACGKVGKVETIDKDGDVVVQFGEQVYVYNPACLIPSAGQKIDTLKAIQTPNTSTRSERAQDELGDSLARLFAHLLILGQHQQLRTIGPEQMVQAAARGDINSVQQIIKLNKELVNCKFKDLTPLMVATHGGHGEILKMLLANGADINAATEDGTTAVFIAAAGKIENIAVYLVDKGAIVSTLDKNRRSLAHHASYNGLNQLLKKVLEKGCDVNLQDIEGDSALHDAIAKGNDKGVDLLINLPKIDLTLRNKMDFNPLIFAAFKENKHATEKLLQKSPDLVKTTKKDGFSALHVAAVNDHREVALILMDKDAEINLKERNGLTPLHLACYEAYFEMVEILIENDANVNDQNKDGFTPLHVTLAGQRRKLPGLLGLMLLGQPNEDSDRVKISCFLLNNGAEIQIQDKNGKTPLQVCRSQRVKTSVENFIKEREQEERQTGSGDLFLQFLAALLLIPCTACQESVANATFQPCGHKVVCEECSVRFKKCPKCRSLIETRLDNEGRQIVLEDPCNVQ